MVAALWPFVRTHHVTSEAGVWLETALLQGLARSCCRVWPLHVYRDAQRPHASKITLEDHRGTEAVQVASVFGQSSQLFTCVLSEWFGVDRPDQKTFVQEHVSLFV